MRIYLASPLGFATSTRHYLLELEKALAVTDATVINPWDNFEQTRAFNSAKAILDRDARLAALAEINREIGRTNETSIRSCDVLIAVLDGADVDSGTASEIGFASALGKRIHGLRTDMRLAGDNEASVVNLQVQYFMEASGGRIVRTAEDLVSLVSAANTSETG
jgi:nucleoside 2-deoxyribosyltransferase